MKNMIIKAIALSAMAMIAVPAEAVTGRSKSPKRMSRVSVKAKSASKAKSKAPVRAKSKTPATLTPKAVAATSRLTSAKSSVKNAAARAWNYTKLVTAYGYDKACSATSAVLSFGKLPAQIALGGIAYTGAVNALDNRARNAKLNAYKVKAAKTVVVANMQYGELADQMIGSNPMAAQAKSKAVAYAGSIVEADDAAQERTVKSAMTDAYNAVKAKAIVAKDAVVAAAQAGYAKVPTWVNTKNGLLAAGTAFLAYQAYRGYKALAARRTTSAKSTSAAVSVSMPKKAKTATSSK